MRTSIEILANPMPLDTIQSRDLAGHVGISRKYVWFSCRSCGIYRWIMDSKGERRRICRDCYRNRVGGRVLRYGPTREGKYKTIELTATPKEGDIIRGEELGHSPKAIYRWTDCPLCGKCRWVVKSAISKKPNCRVCAEKIKKRYIGENSSQWKGGRLTTLKGYIRVIVRPSDPYYVMADHMGYVLEHRLVVARSIGRCLKRSEPVHHKHTRFPASSREDKQDNRLDNLELLPSRHIHDSITILEEQVDDLKHTIDSQNTKIRLCGWRIKELENKLRTNGVTRRYEAQ